ncbi:MAG: DNA-directed RNA polymerase subunit beta [Myxococcales bacterium]|nr:DNA-directed RNA polymerase subunit beta [Myxococcales bacterium]
MARTLKDLRFRKSYARIKRTIEIPDLIDIQKFSYDQFLQSDVPTDKRVNVGLEAIFKSVFPIKDFNKTSSLEYVSYNLEAPKYDELECRERGMTFAAPVKVMIRLVIWDVNPDTGATSIRDVKEQEVYFGEIPLMTDQATFIINGTERVIVSQLHRSPGAFFEHDKGKTHSSGKLLYSARIIPYRGSWLDFEFDHKDLLYVRIDRRRKMFATVLLRALGYSTEELLNYFYRTEEIVYRNGEFLKKIDFDQLKDQRAAKDIVDPSSGEVIVKKSRKFNKKSLEKLEAAGVDALPLEREELNGKVIARDVVDPDTGEIVLTCNQELSEDALEELMSRGIHSFQTLFFDNLNVGSYLRDTLVQDKVTTQEDAVVEIYRRLRPGDPSTPKQAMTYFNNLFFNASRYDLSAVGRLKLNHKFGLEEPLDQTVLTKQDILEVLRYLIDLRNGKKEARIDDIDHLGNRRVRAVGELMENQYRIGLVRMERAIKERMSMSQELDTLMPHDLINAKPVSAVVKEYFGSSQLSQFMDQTNPLSEVTHKRRLSALGPGGLTRDRAGFEVRDVHTTHYGRICPIETPEGPNIGLIASLATYARVNEYGFIETPYRKVVDSVVTDDVSYYSALEEEKHTIGQANIATRVDADGKLTDESLPARYEGDVMKSSPATLDLCDVSPNQLVSVATSLIPFLENDDANRALMGSNMQRQAVPLLRSRAPIVGTGLERVVASDSGVTLVARHDGLVEAVDASRIVVKRTDPDAPISAKPDIYRLVKYQRSNQSTCMNQKPIVRVGDHVKAGDVIADGASTDMGELALGQNVVVAFMPWGGYNFEDSILMNERITIEDVFTSVHIEEFECIARDTKLGKEEITRDIPNVGEEAMKDLDASGIVRIGAEVGPGDILVGKVTPKGETQLSPEEKLLRAIFGEKAGDVRDTSLRVQPGVRGTVISAQVFQRKGVDKDERTMAIEESEKIRLQKDADDEVKIVQQSAFSKIVELTAGKVTASKLVDEKNRTLIDRGVTLSGEILVAVPRRHLRDLHLVDGDTVEGQIVQIMNDLEDQIKDIREHLDDKLKKLEKGDELPPGVIKMVKVYVAIKRKLQVGDKMAGRHGNKGVISRILPAEDMPYLPDGRPVDVVLNPLGVPSRMNVGQILETHLGLAARTLGQELNRLYDENFSPDALRRKAKEGLNGQDISAFIDTLSDEELIQFIRGVREGVHVATPVFDGAREADIDAFLTRLGLPTTGQTVLFDGRTGEAFAHDVTVGVMYMLKLHHLVDDKIHARSIGPYSLVTQQPLGGKAQFGGQRLGEMEVWAMEAYGAAYALQEFLTVKSDDVIGRTRMYEAIVKGENNLEAGLPESFNVLVKELKSLALDVELVEAADAAQSAG